MAFTVTRAPRDPKAAPQPPRKSDGGLWVWGMYLPGYRDLAWGDSPSELVAALVADEGYVTSSPQARLNARVRRALYLQVAVQARINASAVISGDWEGLCEWERAVLNAPRHQAPNMPHGFPTRYLFNGQDLWTADVPLVCLTTACEPLNPGVPPILGSDDSLWTIDPIDDDSLLRSLADIGTIRLFTLSD